MIKRNTALLLLLTAAGLAGCQAVNDGLTATNQAQGALNTALGTPSAGRSGGMSAGTGMVYVPAEIKQRTSAAITNAQVQETNRMIADARPAIENVVGLAACGADTKRMAQYTDPNETSYGF